MLRSLNPYPRLSSSTFAENLISTPRSSNLKKKLKACNNPFCTFLHRDFPTLKVDSRSQSKYATMSSSNNNPVRITTYTRPKGRLARTIILLAMTMALSARKDIISPGSFLYDNLLVDKPNAIKAATWIQNGLFYFLFGAHTIELPIFAVARLQRHGVPFLSLVWLQWMVTCFFGGVACFEHFDKLVKAKGGASR